MNIYNSKCFGCCYKCVNNDQLNNLKQEQVCSLLLEGVSFVLCDNFFSKYYMIKILLFVKHVQLKYQYLGYIRHAHLLPYIQGLLLPL